MNYSRVKYFTIENGEGVRVSLFVCGCRRDCPNCHNKDEQNFDYGQPFTDKTIEDIINPCKMKYISGISILGGEPLEPENIPDVLKLCKKFRETFGRTRTIWLYTGYTFEQLLIRTNTNWYLYELLDLVDVIVDGAFVETLKNPLLQYRGSSNQRIIDAQHSLSLKKACLMERFNHDS